MHLVAERLPRDLCRFVSCGRATRSWRAVGHNLFLTTRYARLLIEVAALPRESRRCRVCETVTERSTHRAGSDR